MVKEDLPTEGKREGAGLSPRSRWDQFAFIGLKPVCPHCPTKFLGHSIRLLRGGIARLMVQSAESLACPSPFGFRLRTQGFDSAECWVLSAESLACPSPFGL